MSKEKKIKIAIVVSMSILLLTGAAWISTKANAQTVMLTNPSFEGEYVRWDNTTSVASGWEPFFDKPHKVPPQPNGGSNEPVFFRKPEYKELPVQVDAHRIRTGEKSQAWFVFSGVMDAGIRQRVQVEKGRYVQASVYGQQWSDNSDDPNNNRAEIYLSVGISARGEPSAWDIDVQWSPWTLLRAPRGAFVLVESPVVLSTDSHVTVFIRSWHKWAVKHGDVYVDDASMRYVDAGLSPTPYPTYTPYPTPLPCPTYPPGNGPVSCPSLEEMRGMVREELANREPERWPR